MAFGLIHGFGFAYVLKEFGLPQAALGWSLFAFNLGVEIGQLLIVGVVAGVLLIVRRRSAALARQIALAGIDRGDRSLAPTGSCSACFSPRRRATTATATSAPIDRRHDHGGEVRGQHVRRLAEVTEDAPPGIGHQARAQSEQRTGDQRAALDTRAPPGCSRTRRPAAPSRPIPRSTDRRPVHHSRAQEHRARLPTEDRHANNSDDRESTATTRSRRGSSRGPGIDSRSAAPTTSKPISDCAIESPHTPSHPRFAAHQAAR